MKTVKKLLSLMLVAILLVSAVPFQASAAGETVTVTISENGEAIDSMKVAKDGITTAIIWQEFLKIEGTEGYANCPRQVLLNGVSVSGALTINDGDTLVLNITTSTPPETTIPATTGNGPVIETTPVPSTTEAPTTEATAGTTPPPAGGNNGGQGGGAQEQSYTVYIDYTDGAEGEPARVYTMKANQAYGDRLPANPQRGGMTFRYWVYRGTSTVVTAESLVDASKATDGKIYIDAVWNVQSLFLELIDIRGSEQLVVPGKTVRVGQPIGTLPTPTREGYTFVGWKLNGEFINANTIWELPDGATAYAVWAEEGALPGQLIPEEDGKVYLEIYLNGDWDLAKRVDISAYVGKNDEYITRAEVEKVVNKYYSAKAGYTLKYIGLFDEDGWYWYTRDQETDGKDSIKITMLDGDIKKDHYIYVMVKNVKVTVADKSNPQTGDGILAVVATMFTTGGAALFLEQKKRKLF